MIATRMYDLLVGDGFTVDLLTDEVWNVSRNGEYLYTVTVSKTE